jgi:hypothetical protein
MLYRFLLIVFLFFSIVFFISCKHDPIQPDVPQEKICFQDKILPILQSNCAFSGCHDAASAQDDVDLSSYNAIMSSDVVKPGRPSDSKLYKVLIKSPNDDKFMPPPPRTPLTPDQKALIYGWIAQGAKNEPCPNLCDTNSFAFAADIFPTIQQYCLGCHSGTTPSAGLSLSDYTQIKNAVINKNLYIRITSTGNPMPPSGLMPQCRIIKIKKWIDAGMQNN